MLTFDLFRLQWRILNPSALAFVEECQIVDRDVMGLHRSTDLAHIQSYVKSLAAWRLERPSGVITWPRLYSSRAIQS